MQKHLLKKKHDFDNIFKNKKIFTSNYYVTFVVKNELNYLRFAIIISKKNFKTSVLRNKVRRQIRTLVYAIDNKNIGLDIIIIPKVEYLNISYNIKKINFLNLIAKILLKFCNHK